LRSLSIQRTTTRPFITGSLGPAAVAASGFFPALTGFLAQQKTA